jgi:hypothetical protein
MALTIWRGKATTSTPPIGLKIASSRRPAFGSSNTRPLSLTYSHLVAVGQINAMLFMNTYFAAVRSVDTEQVLLQFIDANIGKPAGHHSRGLENIDELGLL